MGRAIVSYLGDADRAHCGPAAREVLAATFPIA